MKWSNKMHFASKDGNNDNDCTKENNAKKNDGELMLNY